MSSEDIRVILLGLIAALQAIGIVLIPLLFNRGRQDDKKERALVAGKLDEATAANEGTAGTVNAIHKMVNGRYDELREELRKSNETIAHLMAGRRATHPASAIISTPVPPPPLPKKKRRKS